MKSRYIPCRRTPLNQQQFERGSAMRPELTCPACDARLISPTDLGDAEMHCPRCHTTIPNPATSIQEEPAIPSGRVESAYSIIGRGRLRRGHFGRRCQALQLAELFHPDAIIVDLQSAGTIGPDQAFRLRIRSSHQGQLSFRRCRNTIWSLHRLFEVPSPRSSR